MSDKSPPTSLWGPEALAPREELLREAEQIAHVGSWAWDMRTGHVAWSDELYRILGRDPKTDPATFENFMEAVHPEDRMSVQELSVRATQGDVAERAHYRVVRRDGSVREVDGLAQIFRGDDGTPQRMVGVAMDVTEVRQLESDLRQAQKMEALGRLAGGLAHDFNNLLTVILLNVTALKRVSAASRELQQIDDAATAAAALATQLLAFSRRSPRAPRPLDMNRIGGQALEMFERLVGDNVKMTFTPSTEPATIVADESQMHQVLLNLALNARDAMPNGGELHLAVSRVVRPHGPFVRFSIRDTGIGMDEATRARAFEPFFTTKEPGKGTGLGLAIVFGVVQQNGGHVEVESELGRGSTFHLFLPYRAIDVVPEPRKPAKSDPGRGETIVLVEDSTDVRNAVARVLREAGYDVVEAGRPSQVLESWPDLAQRVSVLVTDQVMPEMSGRDLATKLRQNRPDLPIVFLTGYDPDPAELGDRVWYLTKPISEEHFLANVREALQSLH
jgi:PAS domain S-box-containing protein